MNSQFKKLSAVFLTAGAVVFSGCAVQPEPTRSSTSNSPSSATTQTSATAAEGTVSCSYTASGQSAKPADPPATTNVPASGTVSLVVQLTEGDVTITMDRAKAPCTVNSFISLAQQGYYNDTSCHRLVDQGIYILQCGDPTGTGTGGPGYSFADELTGNETYKAGTVAMANAGPDTNGSQFFFVWADTELPPSYTVFGTIDEESLAVIQKIAAHGVSQENSPAPIDEARITNVVLG